jgi:hypothetical protein
MGGDGFVIFLAFGAYAVAITGSLWKGAIVGLLAGVVSHWIVLALEKREKKLLEPYQRDYGRILGDYQKLRAFAWEIVNRRVPSDFEGPQTITLTEKEIADIREALNTNYC